MASLLIITTGGTFDKEYGRGAGVRNLTFGAEVRGERYISPRSGAEGLARSQAARQRQPGHGRPGPGEASLDLCATTPCTAIVITHGTDTMVATAAFIARAKLAKTIVLTGAAQPARMKDSDADFNLGFAAAAAQCKPPGVYVAMNGQRRSTGITAAKIRTPACRAITAGARRSVEQPACTMASRTAPCAFSLAGTIGSRTVSAHLPSSDSAYLTGAGLVSTNRLMCSGVELVLQLERGGEIALQAGALEFGAQPRRHVRGHRDAAMAAMRHEAERGDVLARHLVEVLAHGRALLRHPRHVGGGVLDAGDVLAARTAASWCRPTCRPPSGRGCCR